MISKLIPIHKCKQCYYLYRRWVHHPMDLSFRCKAAPQVAGEDRRVDDPNTIPEWCPIPGNWYKKE